MKDSDPLFPEYLYLYRYSPEWIPSNATWRGKSSVVKSWEVKIVMKNRTTKP